MGGDTGIEELTGEGKAKYPIPTLVDIIIGRMLHEDAKKGSFYIDPDDKLQVDHDKGNLLQFPGYVGKSLFEYLTRRAGIEGETGDGSFTFDYDGKTYTIRVRVGPAVTLSIAEDIQ